LWKKVPNFDEELYIMNKFTDDFFSFPIKVYDGFSLKKAMEAEDKDTTEAPVPIDWVTGWVKIPAKDLHRMMWHDGFSRERTVEEVAKEGFDLTIVVNDNYGDFVCTWPRKKFEQKLDEFMEKWENSKPQGMSVMGFSTALPFEIISSTSTASPKGDEKKDD
jgi:hypothetical protein